MTSGDEVGLSACMIVIGIILGLGIGSCASDSKWENRLLDNPQAVEATKVRVQAERDEEKAKR